MFRKSATPAPDHRVTAGIGAPMPGAPMPGAAQPKITGGAAMMLKSMGIDPAQMEAVADAFIKDVSAMAARVDAIEARMASIEERQQIHDAVLNDIVSNQDKILAALARIEHGLTSNE